LWVVGNAGEDGLDFTKTITGVAWNERFREWCGLWFMAEYIGMVLVDTIALTS